MFNFFKKKSALETLDIHVTLPALDASDNEIVSIGDGKLIPIESVSDAMFAEKMLGDSVAFKFTGDCVVLSSPVNGTLSVLFPTGHAFGIVNSDGVEVLIHVGVDTVNAKGDGFKILAKKQGEEVKAGDPIIAVDFDKLAKTYDMSTMLIITNPNDKEIEFVREGDVKRGTVVGTIR